MDDVSLLRELCESVKTLRAELGKKIIGQSDVVDDLLAGFLAGGHCLLIGVPGLAKTTLVHSLAQCLDLQFNRIQFTPDLMPSDITGSEILFEDKTTGHREFRFVKGPLFSNIVLADEINRTPPKTQSALLQAMQEKQVTCGGKTIDLPAPFWVLATQNPIEQEGTYPLPEAQQDRFMFSIEIDYPDEETEIRIVRASAAVEDVRLNPVISHDKLLAFRDLIHKIPVADSVIQYAVSLARASRPSSPQCPDAVKPLLTWGAGPRASMFLILAARSYAALAGRPGCDIADVKRAAYPVLRHRFVRSFHAEADGVGSKEIVGMLLERK